jgi:endoglucanase
LSGARLQPVNNSPLSTTELANIQRTVSYCAGKGMYVILDPHDYGFKYDSASGTRKALGVTGGLPASHFADFWKRMAIYFKSQPNVIFGLMNEPYVQTPTEWKAVAVAAVKAIRATGATQKILIPGTRWTGAHSWVSSGNAAAWTGFSDPGNNFAFEVHQYLDPYSTGTKPTCVSGWGATALSQVTSWARTNRYRLFLGEIGWSQDPSCPREGWALMNYMSRSADIWAGWTYWGAGPWYPQTYMFMLDPTSFTTPVDKPQMEILLNNLG